MSRTGRLVEVASPADLVLLVGAPRKGTSAADAVEEHLDELARLADTAGAEVVGRVVQVVARVATGVHAADGVIQVIAGG